MMMALGMGIGVDDFYWLDARELFIYINGRTNRLYKESIDRWNVARHVAFYSISPYLPKYANTRPCDIIPLPIDGDRRRLDPYTEQYIREWSELMDSIPFSDPSEYDDRNDALEELILRGKNKRA